MRTEETTEIDGTIFALAALISELNSSKWFFDSIAHRHLKNFP
ncbi:MAG: hypothetical protein NT096_08590 [Proteobacteria bacterium]|nr:hypothetical protein [Pseudomonadota bacterium]